MLATFTNNRQHHQQGKVMKYDQRLKKFFDGYPCDIYDPLTNRVLQLLVNEDTAGMSRRCIEFWLKPPAPAVAIDAALTKLVADGIVRREIILGREKWFAAWSHHNEYLLRAGSERL